VDDQRGEGEAPKVIDLGNVLPLPWYQKWLMEILCGSFILLYGMNFYIGSQSNLHIATAWGKACNELFVEHFAKVGVDAMLTKQTQNVYSMRATGRINCVGLQAVLKLRRRHDLPSRIWDLINKPIDSLVIDVAMLPEMEPMVFVIVPTKSEKNYRKSNKDVESFTSPKSTYQKLPNFPDSLSILSDNDEVVEALLVPKVVKVLANYKHYIEAIHFTDIFNHSRYTKVLRFVFKLPSVEKMEEITKLIEMALFFIDQVAAVTLSASAKKKASVVRAQAQQVAQKEKSEERQEAIQKRQEEKRKKEQQKYEHMTPEQRAKEDQKRSKRDAKKSQNHKFKVVYG